MSTINSPPVEGRARRAGRVSWYVHKKNDWHDTQPPPPAAPHSPKGENLYSPLRWRGELSRTEIKNIIKR